LNCSILFGVVLITHTFTHALLSSHQLTLIDLTFSGRLAVNISQFNISGDCATKVISSSKAVKLNKRLQQSALCDWQTLLIWASFFYGPRFRIVEKAKQPKNS